MRSSILLHTKFMVPRPGANLLPRPRLVEWLEGHLDKRLILISAPAGYGKTTALVDFLPVSGRPFAWYQLDAADSDPNVFLASLIEALRRMQKAPASGKPALGQTAQSLLESADPGASPQRVMTVLINELVESITSPCVVVLDDYHFVTNPGVHGLVDFLLENAPPGLCLVLSTRVDPPLSLARLRARGQLAELRTPFLRFRDDEIAAWVESSLPGLSAETIVQLSEKTEGWGAALQIMRSSWSESDPQRIRKMIAGLSGSQQYIFDYLAEEVFRRLPVEEQSFLLQTSILQQLDASVCQTLTGSDDAQGVLERLERQNLFLVSLDPQLRWYRYHYLFREFLVSRLQREQPEQFPALQKLAGEYYEQQREYEAALAHYLAAQEYELAAQAIARFASDYVERGRVDVLHRYLSSLPGSVLHANPELLLQHGNVHRRLGQAGSAISAYEDARAEFTLHGDMGSASCALTRLAEVYRAQGNYRQAMQVSSEALAVAPSNDHAARAEALMALAKSVGFLTGMDQGRTLAEQAVEESRLAGKAFSPLARANFLQSLGQICWWHGDPQATVRYCQEALQLAPDDFSPLAAQANVSMATPYLYWCDYDTALKCAERGLEIAQTLHLKELLPSAYAALGNVLTRLGETARAENCLRQAMEIGQQLGTASYEQLMAAGFLAYNLCGQGRIEEARQVAEGALWAYPENPDTYEAFVCRSVLADVALENRHFHKAETLYGDLVEVGERRQFRIPLALVYLGLAYIALESGQKEVGSDHARRALQLIEPTRAVQLFLDQGERASVVCEALAAIGASSPFVEKVLDGLRSGHDRILLGLPDTSTVQVCCLGNFQVLAGGQALTQEQWVSTKARDLLSYFVTFRHDRIPADRVYEALWADKLGRGLTAFHTALSRLRGALRSSETDHRFILVESGDYYLDAARFKIDVDEFDSALAKARAAPDGPTEAVWYQKAVDLYHGEYLQNLYYDWLLPERRRLTQAYLGALRALADSHYDNARYVWSLELLQRALRVDNLQEDLHCQVMRVYAALGDRAGLARQYQELTEILNDELGLEPSTTTVKLYERLVGKQDG
jgi:LuxR family maltose regulon positive regulatory protein